MYVDLITLYSLLVGTLIAAAGMTFWEQRTNPRHSRALRILSAGFAMLAVGCGSVLLRRYLPAGLGAGISNLLNLGGYLLILAGVAALSGRRYRLLSALVLIPMAIVWALFGARWEGVLWTYVSGVPIALVSAVTAWEMRRCDVMKALPSRHIVVAMAAIHALFYAARATVLPALVEHYGTGLLALVGTITLYEGVLYSVVLPMGLLKLVREETHGQLLKESQTDYLTRLGNRRWFFEQGARLIAARANRGPVAVLAFDLDRFKAINDAHGHQAGDEVLTAFAETARGVLGADAILARIGGEEFAALLADTPAQGAAALGQAIAQRFAESVDGREARPGIAATVSVGLARFDDAVPPLSDALAAADRALYRAKAGGGDRLEVA